jgi:hypothetical protein
LIENSIEPLQKEKETLEVKSKELSQLNEVLDVKVEEFSSDAIVNQLRRFEDMLSARNINEMRSMVRDFIHKIEIFPKDDPNVKKWKRRVSIMSYIRALTVIQMASPRGFEPLSPA